MYYVNCGVTHPHNTHNYQVDDDWFICAGIASRDDYDF